MNNGVDACAKAFENILDEVGHFGYFQKRLFLLSTWLQVLATSVVLYFGLLTELPTKFHYKCSDSNVTEGQNQCDNLTVSGPVQNLPEWMYTNHSSSDVETIAYAQSSGLAVGTLLGGFTADLVGRKHALFLSFALMMLSHALIPVCSDFICFGIGRFLANLFAGGFMVPSSVLYIEYVGRNWRDVCICTCLWWLGTIFMSITAAITHNWRYIAITSGVIGLPMSGLYFFVSCLVYRCLMAKVWDLTDNLYIDNCLRYSVDLPIIFTALIISKCIGRRWCIFLYSLSSGFTLVCILLLSIVNDLLKDDEIITGISLFGKLGVAATIILLYLVSLEVFPSTIRCMGTSLVVMCFISGLTVGRYLYVYLTKTYHYTSTFIGYGSCMCFVGFISLLLPETYDKPLPDLVRSRHRIIASKESTRIAHEGWNML